MEIIGILTICFIIGMIILINQGVKEFSRFMTLYIGIPFGFFALFFTAIYIGDTYGLLEMSIALLGFFVVCLLLYIGGPHVVSFAFLFGFIILTVYIIGNTHISSPGEDTTEFEQYTFTQSIITTILLAVFSVFLWIETRIFTTKTKDSSSAVFYFFRIGILYMLVWALFFYADSWESRSVFAIMMMGVLSSTHVSVGHQIQIYRFGSFHRTISEGIHFCIPFIEQKKKIDVAPYDPKISSLGKK